MKKRLPSDTEEALRERVQAMAPADRVVVVMREER
jgi:hypothetical protein